MKTVEDFLNEYSPKDLNFSGINYRQGARITNEFSLTEGYTKQANGELIFNTVYIHTGTDRSALYNKNGELIKNIIVCPFNFNRSSSIYYGPTVEYGYLVQLFTDDYGFEFRIAHMNPNSDVVPEVKKLLDEHKPILQNTILGKAGNFGFGGGAHTHTEVVSLKDTCDVLDNLLVRKYGIDAVENEYSKLEILGMYHTKALWYGKSADEIFSHYESLKKTRNVVFINKYKYQYKESGTNMLRTRYSSSLLFNGL